MPRSISSIGLPKKAASRARTTYILDTFVFFPSCDAYFLFSFCFKKKRDFDMFPNMQLIPQIKRADLITGAIQDHYPLFGGRTDTKSKDSLLNKQSCRTYLVPQKQRCCKQKKKKKKRTLKYYTTTLYIELHICATKSIRFSSNILWK